MNFIDYYPSAIVYTPQINQDDVYNLIANNQEETHYLVCKGFNPVFIRKCFNQSNCRLLFCSDDGFSLEAQNAFIKETPPDRSKAEIIFISSGFSKEAAITFLNNGASFHIWNTDTQVWPSHTVTFLVNVVAYFGRIRINAKGFTAFLIDMFLDPVDPPFIYIRFDDGFYSDEILELVSRGKEKIIIFREGFADSDIEQFKDEGATIVSSGMLV
ncbi:MAG: hypothetical protein R2828_03095 [Saprospiraceae bacterium]